MSNMECAGFLILKSHYFSSKNQPRISPYMFCLLLLTISILLYYGIDSQCPQILHGKTFFSPKSASEHEKLPFAMRETNGSCDLFTGQWVWDNETHPLYKEEDCPFLDAQLTCLANGRLERSYQFWRWQPDGCDLPSFNATLLLESIRGKRMLYVGDSLNRGQFFSMVCLVHSLIPETEKSLKYHDNHITFQAKSYNSTIEFYWAPFLLESNSDNILTHKATDRIVRTSSIEKHGSQWKGADIMIFNTYIWWITGSSSIKVLEGSFDDKPQRIDKVNTDAAYALAINSMVKWVNKNMDMKKTRVFFTSMSPFHVTSADWGGKQGGNCYNETTMIADKTYWNSECRKSMMQVIKDEFTKSDFPISLLNITQLSSYRKDAHLSIYRKFWKPLSSEELANPISYADCVHFCLPGLQDTLNELLFSKLLFP